MATLQELEDAFLQADEAGDSETAQVLSEEIARMRSAASETPRLNIPLDPMGDKPVGEGPTGSEIMAQPRNTGWRRDQLIPREREYTVGEDNRMHDTGESRWAVPGILADIPEQVQTLGQPIPEGGVTDEQIGAMLGLSGFGVGASPGGRVVAKGAAETPFVAAKSMLTRAPKPTGIMGDLMDSIARRQALEKGKPRAEIIREEADRLLSEYGDNMSIPDKEIIKRVVARGGGPVRSAVESYAGRKGLGIGLDAGSLMVGGGSLASMGPGTAAKMMAARASLGLADKATIGGARLTRNLLARKDIRDIGKALEPKTSTSSGGGRSAYSGETVPRIEPLAAPEPVPVVNAEPIKPVAQPPKGVLSGPISKDTPIALKTEEQRLMEEYLKRGGTVTKPVPKQLKTGVVVMPKPSSPKALLSAPAKKTGRAPTLKEAIETSPEAGSWLPDPKAFRKGPVPDAAIARPKSVVAKPAEQPSMDLSTPEPPVAKKAAARQARKEAKGGGEANIEKMRAVLAKKAKRGVGSY